MSATKAAAAAAARASGTGSSSVGNFQQGDLVWGLESGTLYTCKILKAHFYNERWHYFIHFQNWDKKYDVWMDETALVAHHDVVGKAKLEAVAQGVPAATATGTSTSSKRGRQKNGETVAVTVVSSKSSSSLSSSSSSSSAGGAGGVGDNDVGAAVATTTGKRGRRSKAESAVVSTGEEAVTAEAVVPAQAGMDAVGPPLKKKKDDKKVIISQEALEATSKNRKKLALHDLTDEKEDDFASRVSLPLSLKRHLVDEWGLVTGDDRRLISLPRPVTAAMLVGEFLEHKEKKIEKQSFSVYKDLLEGFLLYFDRALPYLLLYRQEREQYEMLAEKLGQDMTPSDIYGGEHLIRLFVRMPRLLAGVVVATADLSDVLARLTELVKFLEKNKERYLVIADYPTAGEALEALRGATKDTLLVRAGSGVLKDAPAVLSETGRVMRHGAGRNAKFDD